MVHIATSVVLFLCVRMDCIPFQLGTAISYHGQLEDGGGLANGSHDMVFNIYDGSDPLKAVLTGNDG